jgi:hypothetical protein
MVLGRDQVAFLGLWVLAGAVVWHWFTAEKVWPSMRASLGPLAVGAAGGIFVTAVPVLLTILLTEDSNRPAIDYASAGQGSLHPALLLTAFVPNLFGADGPLQNHWGPPSPIWGPVDLFLARNMGQVYLGALPIALIMTAGLLRRSLWAREVRFFTIVTGVMLLYALGRYTPFFRAIFEVVPGVDLFRRPADAAFVLGGMASILAGYVVHRWLQGDSDVGYGRRVLSALLIVVPVALCFVIPIEKGTLRLAQWPITTGAFFLALALTVIAFLPRLAARSTLLTMLVLAAVMTADLRFNNGPNESTALPPESYDVLRPDSANQTIAALKVKLREGASGVAPDRVELTGLGFHWPNASLVHQLHNVLGYNPVRLGLYSAATGAGDHVALPEQRTFSPLFPSYRSPLADLLGLRLVATGVPIERIDPKLRPGDMPLVAQTKDGFIYENARTLPRVLFAPAAQTADFPALLRDGKWPEVDFKKTVLLSADAPRLDPPSGGAEQAGQAEIVRYRNNDVLVQVDASVPGYVVLNDPWHPWWFATIDGLPTPIWQANVLFRAVLVPAGSHVVRFRFRPFAGAWRQIEEIEERWIGRRRP